ncbi:MAG: hypothetical protein IRZ16_05385 [Myxococcaceae bacterium]|nr:hypothetical protein [Myxococcaceae bacterium]
MRALVVAAACGACVLTATGCRWCGETSAADAGVDAGAKAGTAQPRGALTGIDLRSALILIFPEYRGAGVHGARAWVERTLNVPGTTAIEPLLAEPAKAKGFTGLKVEGDTLSASRPPFGLKATRAPGQVQESLDIRLAPEEVQKLFTAPTALGSEQLQYMLPKPEGARVVRDTFNMELAYVAKPGRANFLVRQLVEGLITVGWSPDAPLNWPGPNPDGGVGDIPLQTTVTVRRADTGGSVQVTRNVGEVYIKYQQPLVAP